MNCTLRVSGILSAVLMLGVPLAGQGTSDGNISGEVRVLDEKGKPHPSPPADIFLWLLKGPERDRPFRIKAGEFSFKVHSGNYTLAVRSAGFRQHGGPIQVRVPSNGQTEVINPPKPIRLIHEPPPSGPAARRQARGRLELLLVANSQPPAPGGSGDCPPVEGTVTTAGKAVAGAMIAGTAYDETSGAPKALFEAHTDSEGRYALPALPLRGEADYAISVRKDGLEPYSETFSGCPTLPVRIAMQTTTASQPEFRPEFGEASIRHTWTKALLDLPLPGSRSFDQFALLAPGVFPVPGALATGGPGLAPGVGTAGQFSVNGLRARDNSFNLDGSDNNDEEVGARRQGFLSLIPQPVESVQEFQLISALPSARYGRGVGGQINVITKSGTGSHGTIYGLFSGNTWNARDFFEQNTPAGQPGVLLRSSDKTPITLDGAAIATRSPAPGNSPLKRAVQGAAYGRPIREGRTYFYTAFELHLLRSERDLNFSVPSVADRGLQGAGDRGLNLTHVGITGGPNIGIVFTPVPSFPVSIPGNGIFSLFPFPNNPSGPYGENTYTTRLSTDGTSGTGAFRLDQQLGRLGLFNGRFNFSKESSELPSTGGAIFSALRPEGRTLSLAGIWTSSLAPSMSNVLRTSFETGRLDLSSRSFQDALPSAFVPDDPYLLNSPLLLNATRPGTSARYVSATSAEGSALLRQVGLSGVTTAEDLAGPLGQVRIAGFSPVGVDTFRFPQMRSHNTLQIADTFTATLGRTIVIAGFDLRQVRLRSFVDRNARPTAQFHGMLGNVLLAGGGGFPSAASMAALGTPAKMLHTLSPVAASPLRLRSTQADFFVEVERYVSSRLRLTAGVRLTANRLPKDIDDVILGAFQTDLLNQQFDAAEARCPTLCTGLLDPLRRAIPGSFETVFGADSIGNDGRAGFAWDIFGSGRAVLRGGFGSYTGQFPAVVVGESRSGFPSSLPLNLANYPGYPFVPGAPGTSGGGVATTRASSAYVLNLANPRVRAGDSRLAGILVRDSLNRLLSPVSGTLDPISLLTSQLTDLYPVFSPVFPAAPLKHPYAFHQTMLFETRLNRATLLSAGYIGTMGRKLLQVTTPDPPVRTRFYHNQTPSPAGFSAAQASLAPFVSMTGDLIPSVIPRAASGGPPVNPTGISRTFYETSASSSFHSLQTELRGQAAGRLPVQYGLAFTWGHAIDDVSDFFETAGAPALPQNSVRRQERASSGFDSRLRLAGHWIWDLPGRPASRLWGGWRFSGICAFQSGQPYTINSSYDWNGDGNLSDRLDTLAGLEFGPFTDSPTTLLRRTVPAQRLLAPLLPGPNQPGGDGRIGRNTFRAHGIAAVDVALAKQIRLAESLNIQMRIEAFNVLNRANFGIPVRILEAPAFGQSTTTTVPPRSLQILVRLNF